MKRFVHWLIALLLVLLLGGPLYWITMSSFKARQEIIQRVPTFFPRSGTLEHFRDLFIATDYPTYLRNSTYVSLGTMAGNLLVATFGAYALYRLRMLGVRLVESAVLLAYIMPSTLLIVPMYKLLAALNLINNLWGLMVVNITFAAPFSVWLLRGFLDAVPKDLDEAAAVDGAGPLLTLFRVILPLLAPGLATIAIYAFITSWTEFTFASTLIVSDQWKTLPIGLAEIMGQYNVNWGLLTAGTVLTMVPGAVLFGFVGRYFIQGLVSGAIKA